MDEQGGNEIGLENVPDNDAFDATPSIEAGVAPAAAGPALTATPATPSVPESMFRPDEDAVSAVVRLTAEMAAAAQAGSPEQPWLLMARKAASNAIQAGDFSLIARLAKDSPAHLAVVQTDVADVDTRTLNPQRVNDLVFGTGSAITPNQFSDPAEMYIRAKARFAHFSSRAQSNYEAASQLDFIAKRYAHGLVKSGRLIDVAFRDENLALTALGDAALPKELTLRAAIDTRMALAASWFDANSKIHNALNANNWLAYSEAADERIAAMREIAKDPVAIVALGRLARERQADIRSRASADFDLVRTESDRDHQTKFQNQLKEYEGSFLKDLTIKGSDPLHRWIQIQNEIERQERGAPVTGPNLAYLKKLSEKTALEAAANPRDWGRLNQTRPDLMDKLVRDAAQGKESLRTVNKESTIALKTTGEPVINEAAVARNAGESPELAAKKAGPASPDRKAAELRAQKPEPTEVRSPTVGGNPLRADPIDRIATSGVKTNRPAPAPQAEANSGQPGQAAKPAPAAAHPRDRKQAVAMQHTNSKNPEFDEDKGAWESKPNRDLGAFVNARTPYDLKSVNGQLNDPRKLVLAFPLNSFASDRIWQIKKQLKAIARKDPEHFKRMYQATKDTWISWQNAPGERNQTALDQLEIGRRVLAEVGVRAGLIPLDKAVKHAHPLKSQAARRIDAKAKFDPHNFIDKGNAKSLATYYMTMATDAVHQKAKDYHQSSWLKLKANIAGVDQNRAKDMSMGKAVAVGGKTLMSKIARYAADEMSEMAR